MSIATFLQHLGIMNALSIEIERTRREYTELAVGVAQIDSTIEHARAHRAEVAFDLGEHTTKILRAYDWVGQVDDESVLIIMPGFRRCLDERVAELRNRLQSFVDGAYSGESWAVSLGMAWFDGVVSSRDTLLRAAMEALERAKEHPSHVATAPEIQVEELLSAHFKSGRLAHRRARS
ncbi:MAG TPA: hypothetical protein VGC88_11270 [Terriglobales bacterium]